MFCGISPALYYVGVQGHVRSLLLSHKKQGQDQDRSIVHKSELRNQESSYTHLPKCQWDKMSEAIFFIWPASVDESDNSASNIQ